MVKKIIEKIIKDADIPQNSKYQLVELFNQCFTNYYLNNKDTFFDSVELRDLWFYTKIKLLTMMINKEQAYNLLCQELNLNAKKYLNPRFAIKKVGE